ncbi:MAG: ethylbenzene dehydrogenase-related protein [candidate division NC10 bacterium]|nr:ethylbenzene dehydrogenase-related protein [candidate division NC10 bacterium]
MVHRGGGRWFKGFTALGAAVILLALPMVGTAQDNTLVAKKVAAGPTLDGTMKPLWQQATPLAVKLSGGKNLPGGSTEVALRAVYDAEKVYFLAQWNDPTKSERRFPYQKQADGSWKQLVDPADKGGDDNIYYEDKFAMIWAIKSPSIEQRGCFAGCHLGETKPYGNKYLPAGETGDIWHWKSIRTGSVGQIDDQYLDDTKYDKEKSPDAGRKSDRKDGGGYNDNKLVNGKPQWANKGNAPAPPYFILDSEKEPFDDSKYKTGDEVAGILVAPFTGDRGEIPVQATWANGVWTLEWSRKLVTGSPTDVQFDDLKKKYAFGVAVFDNAQVRHAFHGGARFLTFGQ